MATRWMRLSFVHPPPLPALMDYDVIGEILLRLPPDDPASLVRASLVCRSWRRFLSDRGFLRRYRAFHRTPPVLGFLHDQSHWGPYLDDQYCGGRRFPRFVPTTARVPPILHRPAPVSSHSSHVIDCRHGRVLLRSDFPRSNVSFERSILTVWDPVTGDQQRFSSPVDPHHSFNAAVLCASPGCRHLDCHGGPFLVVTVGVNYQFRDDDDEDGDGVAWASVYSSETAAWTASASAAPLDSFIDGTVPSLLAGDALYFTFGYGEKILRYDLIGGALSVIAGPPLQEPASSSWLLATAEDGDLEAAAVEGYSLRLWSWRTDPDDGGVGEWVRGRAIELEAMISISIGDPSTWLDVVGFAEGVGSVFISANDVIFTVELKSGHIRKLGKKGDFIGFVFPFMSFYSLERC
ncbi:hypothetical protein BS78_K052000 [Paspalum vaginatum]|uniref:F-box domain-containing protein n=1 Tax=Paspalum vaginatum TaxID=158149 RepID=A0A9W7X9I0_9POAL|nr:hypothetical protein BS78_K052000 [Paspalum vaginatum]